MLRVQTFGFSQILWATCAALGVLGGVAFWLVHQAAWSWSERDATLRAELAVASARTALVRRWHEGTLKPVLTDIAKDERIAGAVACSRDMVRIEQTGGLPVDFGCAEILDRPHGSDVLAGSRWSAVDRRGGRTWQLTAVPLVDGGSRLGSILVIHDLGFAARRETVARMYLAALLLLLAAGAWALLYSTRRTTYRDSARWLRSRLGLGVVPAEFQTVVSDVRGQVEEWSRNRASHDWTRARLREALNSSLGERTLVVVSGGPVREHDDGFISLADFVLRAFSGIWISSGRSAASIRKSAELLAADESYATRNVEIPQAVEHEQGRFLEGLLTVCERPPEEWVLGGSDFSQYYEANRIVANTVCSSIDTNDALVLVDGSLALLPRSLRERLPRATVVMLWRWRWPPAAHFAACPSAKSLIEGMLAADVVGFQAVGDRENFLDTVDLVTRAISDRKSEGVIQGNRRSLVRSYPVPLEWTSGPLPKMSPEDSRDQLFEAMGIHVRGALLCVHVDTSTGSNRVDRSLSAVERLLERFPEFRGRFVLLLLDDSSAPGSLKTRDGRRMAARLNERFGARGYRPVLRLAAPTERCDRELYYRAADVCWISSAAESIDPIAREFLVCRDDEQGALVLGHFVEGVGCPGAVVVNPCDPERASDALATALRMTPEERRARIRAARHYTAELSAHNWLGAIVSDAKEREDRGRTVSSGSAAMSADAYVRT